MHADSLTLGSWLDTEFKSFTAMHAACLVVCFAVILPICFLGRRHMDSSGEPAWRTRVAWFMIAYWIGSNAYYVTYTPMDKALPLHLCDIAGIFAPIALLTGLRWPRAILYFWGLGLSSMGYITPVITDTPQSIEFWLFWFNHTIIIGTGCYELIARRFVPTWRDFRFTLLASWVYIVPIFLIDWSMGWNYGYVGDSVPQNPTVVDKLGPWPLRVIFIVGLGLLALTLLFLPWGIVARVRRRQETSASDARSASIKTPGSKA
ncbi:MAG: TIGR02206 family membrane protein [Phycisphaerales bacterium]|nr:MAG: TIGR02206 family membrane protein [Phycisphaerales bacterium]